ncbi:uncharacterized protein LOC34618902 [Cyclospora cayetanensis]|uniref:Uncharacterized protein LOC34618902 n=1 Tax=Cyclospora cayetanensis TaxID=88456 RepID=A0A6P6RYU3_9EIME|nr:uncharacterized protein LOC34618902 [Cyclospora cayetanensis]
MLLQRDPALRPTAAQLMKVKYFRKGYRCCGEPFAASPSLTLVQQEQRQEPSSAASVGCHRRPSSQAEAAAEGAGAVVGEVRKGSQQQVVLDLSHVDASSWATVYKRKAGTALCGDEELLSEGSPTDTNSRISTLLTPLEPADDCLTPVDGTSPTELSPPAGSAAKTTLQTMNSRRRLDQQPKQQRRLLQIAKAEPAAASVETEAAESAAGTYTNRQGENQWRMRTATAARAAALAAVAWIDAPIMCGPRYLYGTHSSACLIFTDSGFV